jgi:hypothetical protein
VITIQGDREPERFFVERARVTSQIGYLVNAPIWRRDHFCRSFSPAWVMGAFSDDCSDSSLCRVKLDPNALIKERYVRILTAKLIQSRWRPNGNIAIRHLEYRPEKWRSVTLDCHSNFHRRTPLCP